MALLKDPFAVIDPKLAKKTVEHRLHQLVKKGAEMSNPDLYNLCLLNKERDEIEEENA